MSNGVEKLKEMLLKMRNVVQVFLVDFKLNVDKMSELNRRLIACLVQYNLP